MSHRYKRSVRMHVEGEGRRAGPGYASPPAPGASWLRGSRGTNERTNEARRDQTGRSPSGRPRTPGESLRGRSSSSSSSRKNKHTRTEAPRGARHSGETEQVPRVGYTARACARSRSPASTAASAAAAAAASRIKAHIDTRSAGHWMDGQMDTCVRTHQHQPVSSRWQVGEQKRVTQQRNHTPSHPSTSPS